MAITLGGLGFTPGPSALQELLRRQNVGEGEIDRVLKEVGKGDATGLGRYGLGQKQVLPPPDDGDGQVNRGLSKFGGFNFLEVMLVLHEAAKQLREANREMRHAERDMAVTESMMAAAKIRSAALLNLVVGCVQGAVSIGMGVASIASSAAQLGKMAKPGAEMKAANLEMKQAQADNQLAQSQVRLQEAKVQLADMRSDAVAKRVEMANDVRLAEQKVATLETRETQVEGIDFELEEARVDLADKKAALAKHETDSQKAITLQQDKVAALEARVQGDAAKAQKANDKQIKSLEKAVKEGEAQNKGLKEQIAGKNAQLEKQNAAGDTAGAAKTQKEMDALEVRQRAVENKLAGDQAKLAECRSNASGLYQNPTSDASLAGARGRLDATNQQLAPGGATQVRHADAQAEMNRVSAHAQAAAGVTQGLNQAGQGVNQILGGLMGYFAEAQKADGAEATARAQAASSKEAENADFQKSFNELLQSVQDIVKQFLQAQAQADQSIIRNM